MVHFDRSGYVGRSVGPKCPFPFVKIVVPSTALLRLLYAAYKNYNQTCVCVTGMYREMGTYNFRNFRAEFLLNGKRLLIIVIIIIMNICKI